MSTMEQIRPATAGDAQDFHKQGMEQLDHLLIGEDEAKLGMLVAMASGLNIVLVGHPGGGKTTLGRDAHYIIDGVESSDVVTIPVQADLQPQQMIDGIVTSAKEVKRGDEKSIETTKTAIKGIMKSY